MLELHQFEIARNEVDTIEVSRPNDVPQRPLGPDIADSAVNRIAVAQVEFRLNSEHRRQGGLRIEIKCKDPVTLESEKLRQI